MDDIVPKKKNVLERVRLIPKLADDVVAHRVAVLEGTISRANCRPSKGLQNQSEADFRPSRASTINHQFLEANPQIGKTR